MEWLLRIEELVMASKMRFIFEHAVGCGDAAKFYQPSFMSCNRQQHPRVGRSIDNDDDYDSEIAHRIIFEHIF